MKIYVNRRDEIKAVGTTSDSTLTEIEISDGSNPFADWSATKICCYKVEVKDGKITKYVPYVNSTIIDQLDSLSKTDAVLSGDVVDTQLGLAETYEKVVDTESDVTDIELAITELYELMLGGV